MRYCRWLFPVLIAGMSSSVLWSDNAGPSASLAMYSAEARAVEAVKKLGGKAEGDPIRAVDLSHSGVTDAALKELAACRRLEKLNLFACGRMTEAGLKQ